MSNVPAPLPDATELAAGAAQVASDNPQGAAADVANPPQTEAPAAPAAPEALPPMPKLQPGSAPQLPPLQGQDAMLYGPTSRPSEPVTHLASAFSKPQPPDNLKRYVPALKLATMDPEAPPLLHNIYQLLAYHLGE